MPRQRVPVRRAGSPEADPETAGTRTCSAPRVQQATGLPPWESGLGTRADMYANGIVCRAPDKRPCGLTALSNVREVVEVGVVPLLGTRWALVRKPGILDLILGMVGEAVRHCDLEAEANDWI